MVTFGCFYIEYNLGRIVLVGWLLMQPQYIFFNECLSLFLYFLLIGVIARIE